MSKKSTQRKAAAQNAPAEQPEKAASASPKPAKAPSAPQKPYFAGIDIIKILAAFFVVGIHTFLYNGFYYAEIHEGETKYLVPIAVRWIVYTCVPLFMIATGYLMKNKKFSPSYYKGLIRIIAIYIFIGILCLKVDHTVFGAENTTWNVLKKYLEFNAADYGWYVNYYIALFCMIPFLNLAFNGLETKNQKLILLITITAFTVFARSMFIGFEYQNQSKLFPDYLNGMWPLAYYYAGAYIREYPPKRCFRNKFLVLVVLASAVAFITSSSYKHTIADTNKDNYYHFTSWHFNDYSTYPIFIIAVCIFLLLFDITTTNSKVKFVLQQLSGATFATYLISYIFDRKVYGLYGAKYPPNPDGSWNYDRWTHVWQPWLYVFLHALFWGMVITYAYKIIASLCSKGVDYIRALNAEPEPAGKKKK
ncbi:MAG: acyltransferase [Ruminococcus sp.]|nr:acyltransferase [Ruminococcus sp.]